MQIHSTRSQKVWVLVLGAMLTRVTSSKSLYSSGSQVPHLCQKEFELAPWVSNASLRQDQSPAGLAKAQIAGCHLPGF